MDSRISRALTQRMYLLHCGDETPKGKIAFTVEGSTSNTYLVELKKVGCACSCKDFETRGQICKHIIFILVRVAKMPLETMCSDPNLFVLSDELKTAIKKATNPTPVTVADTLEPRQTNECGVCYEDFTVKDQDLQKCTTCSKVLHGACMQLWIASCMGSGNLCTCPYCRALMCFELQKRRREDDDCLSKMIKNRVKRTRVSNKNEDKTSVVEPSE